MKGILIIFSTLILLGSCTIEKRLHNPGYNIQWNKVHRTSFDRSNLETDTRNSDIRLAESPDQEKELSSQIINQTIDSTAWLPVSSDIQIEEITSTTVPQKISQSFTSKTISQHNYKRLNENFNKQSERTEIRRDVDWELLGNIGAGLLLLAILGFALFGSGTLASIAAILIAIGYVVITIAAIVCICWFLWFIFFGWWLR